MKLLSCHIENFGGLHDFDMTFTDGLNVVCRENGWGKSTLAAFFKAMFYGLDGAKKRDLDENERKRYCPWQGGVFGGQLAFETDGRKYSVTRTFGDTPAKDTFELRNAVTNLPSQDYTERLGEELFKLNAASFSRSIFIGQNDCLTSSTDDIHAKIGNLADNTGDMNSYESADERLKKQINALSPTLKTGQLYRLTKETAGLRRKTAEGNHLEGETADCMEKIAEEEEKKKQLSEKRAALEAEQKRAIKAQELLLQRKEWERLKKQRDESKALLDEAMTRFPAGVPDEDALKEHLSISMELKSAESLMHSYELSPAETGRLAQTEPAFTRETPSSDDFGRYFRLARELRKGREQYEKLRLSDQEQERFNRLSAAFSQDEISPEELAERWNQRQSVNGSIGSKFSAAAAIETSVKKMRSAGKRRAFLLCAAGIAVIAASVALFVFFSDARLLAGTVAGTALLVAGILLAFLIMGNIIKKVPEDLILLKKDIAQDETFIIETDAYTESYLTSHGMWFNEQEVPPMLREIMEEKRELDILSRKNDAAEGYRREKNLTALHESISDFLRKYGAQPDADRLTDQLYELKETVSEYTVLSGKLRQYESARHVFLSNEALLKQFLCSYGFSDSGDLYGTLEAMRAATAEYRRLSAGYAAAEKEAAAFTSANDIAALSTPEPDSAPSLSALSEEISKCTAGMEEISRSILLLKQQRDELSQKYAAWENDRTSLSEKTEKLSEERIKYERLLKTREFLRRAKENMVARYVEPVSQSFRMYHEAVTGASSEHYLIDAQVNLTVREYGQQREIKALSAGFRDLAGVCLRLGLADAMFREEKPMLIMDDPFIALDDQKTAASGNLLQKVSEKYQVIYFTCSSTRS